MADHDTSDSSTPNGTTPAGAALAGVSTAQLTERTAHLRAINDKFPHDAGEHVRAVLDDGAPCPRYAIEHFTGFSSSQDTYLVLADDLDGALAAVVNPPSDGPYWESAAMDLDTGICVRKQAHDPAEFPTTDISSIDVFLSVVAARLRAGERPQTVSVRRGGGVDTPTIEYGNDDYDGGGPYALVYWAPDTDWKAVIEDGSNEGTWGEMSGFRLDLAEE